MSTSHRVSSILLLAILVAAAGCAPKTASNVGGATPTPPSTTPAASTAANTSTTPAAPPAPREVVSDPVPPPVRDTVVSASSLDDLNRTSPLQPVFFVLDSSDLDKAAQAALNQNAAVLAKHPTWVVTIEGHCDERGTAEYNLPLGERRAVAARAYLLSLGIPAGRMQVLSYGKEFPFDSGHDEGAWAKNRRAHFVITAQ